jgi:hypothetical protein
VVSDNDLRDLLPSTLEFLCSTDLECRGASQMIITLLAKRVTFESSLLVSVLEQATLAITRESLHLTLLTLVTVCQHQPLMKEFPSMVLEHLIAWKGDLLTILSSISAQFEAEKFLLPLLTKCFDLGMHGTNDQALSMVCPLLLESSTSNSTITEFTTRAISSLVSAKIKKPHPSVCKLVKQIQSQRFALFDRVINELLAVSIAF